MDLGYYCTQKQRSCTLLLQILPHFFDHVFFFCNDFLCQILHGCGSCRILMQITVQGFYAHIAAICDQICHRTV